MSDYDDYIVMSDKINSVASIITLDQNFIYSDLKAINLTPAERSQTAYYDSMAGQTNAASDKPLGKQVW